MDVILRDQFAKNVRDLRDHQSASSLPDYEGFYWPALWHHDYFASSSSDLINSAQSPGGIDFVIINQSIN